MFVTVKASNPPHPGTFTPGRFWPNGVSTRVEVVEDEVAEKQMKPPTPGKGKVVDLAQRKLEIAAGPFLADGKPDPERITRSGVEAIKANSHMSIIGDEDARGAAEANADLAEAEVEISILTEENAKLLKANAELAARVTELEAAATKVNASKGKAKDEKPADPVTGEAK